MEGPNFKSDVRDGLEAVKEQHEHEVKADGSVVFGKALVELYECQLDFDTGRVIADGRVDTPRINWEGRIYELRATPIGLIAETEHGTLEAYL